MFSLRSIRRLSKSRFGVRALAAVLTVSLLIPNFACRCADGVEVRCCLPGACGRCPRTDHAHSTSRAHACCQSHAASAASGCCGNGATNDGHGGCQLPNGGVRTGNKCCQLVIHAGSDYQPQQKASSIATQPLADFVAVPAVPAYKLIEGPGFVRDYAWGQGPPPIDLIITLQHLTI